MRNLLFLILLFFALQTPLAAKEKVKTAPVSKEQAAKSAQRQIKGRVLKVDKRQGSYRVKVLKSSGRVVSVEVDSKSGKVKSVKKD